MEGRGRGSLGKYLNEKRKSEMVPKPGLPKKHTNEGTQIKKKNPMRYKSAKCCNERYKYKTEFLEQHNRLNHSQHEKKKYKN